MISYGSLFSGIGGFDLGFDRAGMQCAWQIEYDKNARSVLEKHWPDVPKYEDVRNVGRDNLSAVDLICGGFPCQDVSVAGKRAGLAGKRSGLWFEFHRVIGELKPQWVVIENVFGLLSSNGGADFAVILRGLVECGYGVCWRVLDSQYFRVAQRRRRVFIVGSLGDGRAAEVLFEREGLFGHPPTRGAQGQDVAQCLTSGVGQRYDPETETLPVIFGAQNSASQGDSVSWHVSPSLDKSKTPAVAFTQNTRDEVRQINGNGQIAGALGAQPGMKQQNYVAYSIAGNAIGRNPENGPQRGDYSEGIAHNLNTTDRHGVTVPSGVRRLTPTECERLQSFPDCYTGDQSDNQRYKQLGNAVTVNVAEWIGKRIVNVQMEA